MGTRATMSGLPFMLAHEMISRFVQPKKGEQVLILADSESEEDFVHAFAAACNEYGAKVNILIMPPTFLEDGERHLSGLALAAMRECDIYIPLVGTTFYAIHEMEVSRCLHDKDRPKQMRMFIPGARHAAGLSGAGLKFTLEALRKHDYTKVVEWGNKFCKHLNPGKEIRVTSEVGTDLVASIEGIDCFRPHGAFALAPGTSGLIPDGETAGGPKEFTAEGVVAIDGPIAYVAPRPALAQPVMVTVKAGRVVDIKGGEEAEALKKLLFSHENGDVLAEISLGTNPYLEHTGIINITDKRILGTMHVAFGDNLHQIYPYGTVWSPIHVDCVLLKPSCSVDGVQLLKDGIPVV